MHWDGKSILWVLVLGVVLLNINFPILESQIVGAYKNNNFNAEPFYAEIPYIKDSLTLNRDKTFSSKYYGEGTYEVNGVFNHELTLLYGNGKIVLHLSNKLFRPIKIILVYDLNYYYEKG